MTRIRTVFQFLSRVSASGRQTALRAVLFGGFFLGSGLGFAVETTPPPAVRALALNFSSKSEGDVQANSVVVPKFELDAAVADAAAAPAATLPTTFTYDLPGGIKFTPRGRIEADSVWVTQSPANKAAVGDLQNTTGFRRARLGAKLEIPNNVEWLSEFDFSGSQFRITDVYIGFVGLPVVGEARIGKFRLPFGLEAQTSSNHITFLEPGLNNALVLGREWGVAMFAQAPDQHGTLSVGAFRSGSDSFGKDSRDQNDMAYAARATRLFWFEDTDDTHHWIHLGGAYVHQRPPDHVLTFDAQQSILEQGDSPLDPLLTAPVIPADWDNRFGVELASVFGRLCLQAEWMAVYVHQLGGPPVFYHGGYLYASMFLTGEYRSYSFRKGAFDAVHVLRPFGVDGSWRNASWHGIGAWELAVRYSYLNLDDPSAPPTASGSRPGGKLGMFTLGLNCYLNDRTRFMLDYSPTVLANPGSGAISTAHVIGIRFAAFW